MRRAPCPGYWRAASALQHDIASLDREPAAIGHGMAGVDRQVHEHLLDLAGVHFDQSQGGRQRRG